MCKGRWQWQRQFNGLNSDNGHSPPSKAKSLLHNSTGCSTITTTFWTKQTFLWGTPALNSLFTLAHQRAALALHCLHKTIRNLAESLTETAARAPGCHSTQAQQKTNKAAEAEPWTGRTGPRNFGAKGHGFWPGRVSCCLCQGTLEELWSSIYLRNGNWLCNSQQGWRKQRLTPWFKVYSNCSVCL